MTRIEEKARRRGPVLLLAAVSLIAACSGGVGNPEQAIDRMYGAYGGRDNVELLASFTGKGYMRQLPMLQVANSYPFDVYQDGPRYKTVTYRLRRGELEDVQVLVISGEERLAWSAKTGLRSLPSWEVALQRYRFPLIMTWLDDPGESGRHVTDEGAEGDYRIRYEMGEDILTVVLDESEWLLREIRLENSADSTFLFREVYGDYREVEGIPFPNRFTGFMGERKYYEYLIPVLELGAETGEEIFRITPEETTMTVEDIEAPGE